MKGRNKNQLQNTNKHNVVYIPLKYILYLVYMSTKYNNVYDIGFIGSLYKPLRNSLRQKNSCRWVFFSALEVFAYRWVFSVGCVFRSKRKSYVFSFLVSAFSSATQ